MTTAIHCRPTSAKSNDSEPTALYISLPFPPVSTTFDFSALDRLGARLRALGHLDATPLMHTWMRIIEEDNRKGVLAGLDRCGLPMAPVKYRPKATPAQKPTKTQRNGVKANQKGPSAGFGPWASGLNNNLTSSEYRLLGGPPLAPRGKQSRVITNLETTYGPPGGIPADGRWFAAGAWDQVVSRAGIPFLPFHFRGEGRLPRRDLAGVRPDGVEKARAAMRAWAISEVRRQSP